MLSYAGLEFTPKLDQHIHIFNNMAVDDLAM